MGTLPRSYSAPPPKLRLDSKTEIRRLRFWPRRIGHLPIIPPNLRGATRLAAKPSASLSPACRAGVVPDLLLIWSGLCCELLVLAPIWTRDLSRPRWHDADLARGVRGDEAGVNGIATDDPVFVGCSEHGDRPQKGVQRSPSCRDDAARLRPG